MRISRLELKNWMIHRHLDIEVTPLTIIAGPNESGKSSIADALGFVIFNELRRVETKSQRPDLISEGAKAGTVTIYAGDAAVAKDIGTGKRKSDTMIPTRDGAIPQAVPYLLTPSLFARTSPEERRTVLSSVMKSDCKPETLIAEMKKRGAKPKIIDALKLTDDLDKWRQTAKEHASQARGAWKQIAGETYGALKAETWTAEVPELPEGDQESLEIAVKTARDKMVKASGALAARNAIDQMRANRAAKVGPMQKIAESLATRKADAEEAERTVSEAKQKLQHERAMRPPAGNVDHTNCPSCGTLVTMTDEGALEEVIRKPAAAEIAAQRELDDAETALTAAKSRLQEAERAQASIAALTEQAQAEAPTESIESLQAAATAASSAFDEAATKLANHKTAKEAHEKAKKATSEAKAAHERVNEWVQCEMWLALDGIPGDQLAKALQPFNRTLASLSNRAGWKIVTLSEDMQISVGGRGYRLQSESGQWRADTVIAIALAIHSEIRMATIDRFDVLNPEDRPGALRFFRSLTKPGEEEIDTLIVFGTFKAAPAAPKGVAVHWLGAQAEQQEAA
jgi:hypothetical protein